MNILIIEMGGSHIESVYSLIHFARIQHHQVFLSCNKKLLSLIPDSIHVEDTLALPDRFTFFNQIPSFLAIRRFMKRHRIDSIVFGTTEIKPVRNFSFFIPARINCTGIVHYTKKLEKSGTFTRILIRRVRKFFVLGDYLLKQVKPYPAFRLFPLYSIFFPPPGRITIQKPSDEFWVAIPGIAEPARRDYLPLLQSLSGGALNKQVKILFLGLNKLQDIMEPGWAESAWWKSHIITFDSYLDYDRFHSYLSQSDLILPLIKMENDAMYGDSRITGAYNLGWGYKKPFLLPMKLHTTEDLRPYSFFYANMSELIAVLNELSLHSEKIKDVQTAYRRGRFSDVSGMAREVIAFIESRH